MDGSRLRLTGVGEGFTTLVSTTLSGVDSPAKVLNAVRTLFPEADRAEMRDDNGIISVDCAFCSRQFPIDA